jgi:gas vesicle protein
MFTKKKSTLLTFLWSFSVGAIAGGAFALLYAPMTGKKFQKKVFDVTDKVIDKVEDLRKVVNG